MTALVTPSTKTITLEHGVKLGDNIITEITITKPLVSHLKGVSLTKLVDMQLDEVAKIIPRVTSPMIPQQAFDTIEFTDFLHLCGELLGFLTNAATEATPDE